MQNHNPNPQHHTGTNNQQYLQDERKTSKEQQKAEKEPNMGTVQKATSLHESELLARLCNQHGEPCALYSR